MAIHLTTEKKLGAAFFVALATITGLAFTFYHSTQELFKSNRQVVSTLELMVVLGNTLSRLNEAETAQRGYILTGDRAFLMLYPASISAVDREIQKLEALVLDHPGQRAALGELKPLIKERVTRMEESIQIRRTEGFEQALELVVTRKGTELMQQIRSVIHEMEKAEELSLKQRYERREASSRNTLAGFLIVILLNFLLLSLVFVVVKRDLSERQRSIERQGELVKNLERANQQLRDFAHVVSHDLKAPLRGINSLATFLQADYHDKLDSIGRENLDLLNRRVQRMHDLIEGILQYSSLSHGKVERTSVELQKLVYEIWGMLAPPADAKLLVPRPLPTISTDRIRVFQVFQNLISNGIKFNASLKPVIEITWTETPKEWTFKIADNGPGIEEKHFTRIFQLFQTLQARDDQESTGIGLALVKKAVEMLSGRVWVESELGKGSSFFFSLPK
jgi:signal transduction histidine kinase